MKPQRESYRGKNLKREVKQKKGGNGIKLTQKKRRGLLGKGTIKRKTSVQGRAARREMNNKVYMKI